MRTRMVDAGIDILERDGLPGLSVRNLAAEVGTSTMAVYRHFGGMTGVLDAVASEAFARFAQALTALPESDDPVAGFFGHEGHALVQITGPLTIDVLVGMGDERDRAIRSLDAALSRLAGG